MSTKDVMRLNEAAKAYASFMDIVLPGWKNDPNSIGTPERVAKMFLWSGLNSDPPKITVFENADVYDGMVWCFRVT